MKDAKDMEVCLRAQSLLREGWEVHEVAAELGIHSRTLRRIFSRAVGMPPHRWMVRQGILPARVATGCTPIVCFRLAEFDELVLLAKSRDMSPADLAREIVIDYLDRVHAAAQRHDLPFP